MSQSDVTSPQTAPIEMRPAQRAYLLKLWNELLSYRQPVEARIMELTKNFQGALEHIMDDLGIPNDGSYELHSSAAAFVPASTTGPVLVKGANTGQPASPDPTEPLPEVKEINDDAPTVA